MRWLVAIAMLTGLLRPATAADDWPNVRVPELNPDRLVRTLPAAVDHTTVGGAGRFLIFRLPSLRVAAVFDVNYTRIEGYLRLNAPDDLIVAGLEDVFVIGKQSRLVRRWSLKDLRRNGERTLPGIGTIRQAAMGAAASGSFLIFETLELNRPVTGGLKVVDSESLDVIPVTTVAEGETPVSVNDNPPAILTASDYGTLFHLSNPHSLIRFDGATMVVAQPRQSGWIPPGPYGGRVYGNARGAVADNRMEPPRSVSTSGVMIPAVDFPAYARITVDTRQFRTVASVGVPGARAAAQVQLEELPRVRRRDLRSELWNQRVWFLPRSSLFVVLEPDRRSIRLVSFDAIKAISERGQRYLEVVPPVVCRLKAGESLEYRPQIVTNHERVETTLIYGPEGLQQDDPSKLTWKVPDDFREQQTQAMFRIRSGDESRYHRVPISVTAARSDSPGLVSALRPLGVVSTPTRPSEVTPAPIGDEPVTIDLPAPSTDSCVAGSGRFIVFRLSAMKKLAVVDLNHAKIVAYVPIPHATSPFAGGRDAIIVGDSKLATLERWDLATFRRENRATIDMSAVPGWSKTAIRIGALLMGSATDDRVIVVGDQQGRHGPLVCDANTLAPRSVEFKGLKYLPTGGTQARISANGDVLVSTHPAALQIARWDQGAFDVTIERAANGAYCPSAHGDRIDSMFRELRVPALQGSLAIRFVPSDETTEQNRLCAHVAAPADSRILFRLPELCFTTRNAAEVASLVSDKSVWFSPAGQVVAKLSEPSRRLTLVRVNVDERLKASGEHDLYVDSSPPVIARPGDRYRYRIRVKSKTPLAGYELTGPDGMQVSDDGVVTWSVPDFPPNAQIPITVAIRGKSGEEIIHTFTINVPGFEQIQIARREALHKAEAERQRLESMRRQEEQRRRQDEARRTREMALAEARRKRDAWLRLREQAIADDDAGRPPRPDQSAWQARNWTDRATGSSISATFVGVLGDNVILQRPGSTELVVKRSDLGDDDLAWVSRSLEIRRRQADRVKVLDAERHRRHPDASTRNRLLVESSQKLHRIGQAIQRQRPSGSRHIPMNSFDPVTKQPLLSWRVHILPRLGLSSLYRQFDLTEPWYSEHNRRLIERMPDVYRAPGSQAPAGRTVYLGVTGGSAVFIPLRAESVPITNRRINGRPVVNQENTPLQAAAIVEVNDDLAATWTRPDEFDVDAVSTFAEVHGQRDDGVLCVMEFGHVELLRRDAADEAVRSFFTLRTDGEPADRQRLFVDETPAKPVPVPLDDDERVFVPSDSVLAIHANTHTWSRRPELVPLLTLLRASLRLDDFDFAGVSHVTLTANQTGVTTEVRTRHPVDWLPVVKHFGRNFDQQQRVWPQIAAADNRWQFPLFTHSGRHEAVFAGPQRLLVTVSGSNGADDLSSFITRRLATPAGDRIDRPDDDAVHLEYFGPAAKRFAITYGLNQRFAEFAPLWEQTGRGELTLQFSAELTITGHLEVDGSANADHVVTALETLRARTTETLFRDAVRAREKTKFVAGCIAIAALNATRIEQDNQRVTLTLSLSAPVIASAIAGNIDGVGERLAAARRVNARRNNLRQLLLAMHSHHDAHRRFPGAGNTRPNEQHSHSWRIAILPYLASDRATRIFNDYEFNEPWDSPHNREVTSLMPDAFRDPDDDDPASTQTRYIGLTGDTTAMPAGVGIRIRDITDGTSNVIMLIEADKSGHWANPHDPAYDHETPLAPLRKTDQRIDCFVGLCDGSARYLSPEVDEESLRRLIERNDGQPVPGRGTLYAEPEY